MPQSHWGGRELRDAERKKMHGIQERANKEQFPTEELYPHKNHHQKTLCGWHISAFPATSQAEFPKDTDAGHRPPPAVQGAAFPLSFRGKFSKGIPTFGNLAEQNPHFAANRHLEEALPTHPCLPPCISLCAAIFSIPVSKLLEQVTQTPAGHWNSQPENPARSRRGV